MPQLQSSKKRLRQAKTRTERNRARKEVAREAAQAALEAAETGDEQEVDAALRAYQKAIDKAVKSGAIREGTADRRKSRLMKRINRIRQQD